MSSLARGFVFVRCCAGGRRCGVRPGACSEGSFARGGDDSRRLRKQVRLFFWSETFGLCVGMVLLKNQRRGTMHIPFGLNRCRQSETVPLLCP